MVDGDVEDGMRPVCEIRSIHSAEPDPLADVAIARSSHRAAFDAPSAADRSAASTLVTTDLAILSSERQVSDVAEMADRSSILFMRQPRFRRELLSWMRLTRLDRRWRYDGLNADAMAMGTVEAVGAGAVLGPLFGTLDAVGAAKGLLSDARVTRTSSAIAVLHLPAGTSAFDTGRAFMRAWLRFEREGFRGAVMASLVDDGASRDRLAEMAGVPEGRSVQGVWRIGRTAALRPDRARLRQSDLVVRTP
jgi:hypothetical protein